MNSRVVRKAVIPAAGLGTRFLPATKVVPKEMLPLVDKPLLQYAIEEAVASGCTDIVVITSRGKGAMEDHFDRSPDLEESLRRRGKFSTLSEIQDISRLANISYLRQQAPLGLGHAISLARTFVGDDIFGVLLPDDVVIAGTPCLAQLIAAYMTTQTSVIASELVVGEAIQQYGCIESKPSVNKPRLSTVVDIVEKPRPAEAPSQEAVIGRYILTPSIFSCLDRIRAGSGGELQLTDALRLLLESEQVSSLRYEGQRHDAGDKLGFVKATIDLALQRNDFGPELELWLRKRLVGVSIPA